MEHIARALAQRRCSRDGRHIRHTRFFDQWQDGRVVGRANARQQGKGAALRQHLLDIVRGALGHIAVIQHVELQRAAVYAAPAIDVGQRRFGTQLDVLPQPRQRARESARATNGEGFAGDARLLGKGIAKKSRCRCSSDHSTRGKRDKLATLHKGPDSGKKAQ